MKYCTAHMAGVAFHSKLLLFNKPSASSCSFGRKKIAPKSAQQLSVWQSRLAPDSVQADLSISHSLSMDRSPQRTLAPLYSMDWFKGKSLGKPKIFHGKNYGSPGFL